MFHVEQQGLRSIATPRSCNVSRETRTLRNYYKRIGPFHVERQAFNKTQDLRLK